MSSPSRILAGAALVAALAVGGAAEAYTVPSFSAPGINNPGYPSFVTGVLYANVQDENASLVWNSNYDGKKDGAWVLSISANAPNVGVFNFPSGAYTIGSETETLTAYLSNTGALLTGEPSTFKITGTLEASSCLNTQPPPSSCGYGTTPSGVSWSAVSNQTLFSVNLTKIGVDSTHDALGFNTDDFGGWANQKQFTGGSTSESLWLYALINTGNLYCVGPRPNNNCNNSPNQTGTFPYSTSNSAWNTFLTEIKNGQQLKAATFYGIGAIATVPIPAALLLFGSGLASLGAMARRRKAKTLEA
jgi:hypothetical protein